ncbi:MAG: choice-of-anchor D domain-containing protein [Myxococcales bacterium]|nr:MAG: choice-of-anchor D domain-containing protein [Myxococcales bacterium]
MVYFFIADKESAMPHSKNRWQSISLFAAIMIALLSACTAAPTSNGGDTDQPDAGDGDGTDNGFGQPCFNDSECASGFCGSADNRSFCTIHCEADADCLGMGSGAACHPQAGVCLPGEEPSDGDSTDGDLPDGDTDNKPDGDGSDIESSCERHCLVVRGGLDFGSVLPGECSELSLVLASAGDQSLTVIDVLLTPGTSEEFVISGYVPDTTTMPTQLPPLHELTVTVRYCPTDIREDEGTLVVASNDDVKPRVEVPVSMGWKGSVTMGLAPEAIGFGERLVETRKREFFTIKAEPDEAGATRPLEITSIALEDEENGVFSLPLDEVECALPLFIEAGDQKVCAVDFRPSAQGEFTETLTVVGTDYVHEPPFTATIALTGGGIAPLAAVDPSSMEFGYILVSGGAAARASAISNNGTGILEILSTSWVSNSGAFSVHNDPAGKTIEAGDDPVSFAVKFDPTAPGVQVGTLNISTNDPAHPVLQVSASGIGVEICPPGMVPDPEHPGSSECVVRCEPGEWICVYEEAGWGYRVCQDDGKTLGDFESCPIPGQICEDGACVDAPCDPGEHGCYIDPESGLHYERSCLSDASGWEEATECVGGTICRPSVCEDPHSLCRLVNAVQGTPCEDGNQCTENDGCTGAGICQGTARTCDDDEPCTDDQCIPDQGCVYTSDNANDCSDGNPCTSGDHCDGGRCVPAEISIDCNDNNECTLDECDPEANPPCRHTAITGNCEDGNICTKNDYCQSGLCLPGPVDTCDDENSCTTDACVTPGGCRNTPRTGNCEDGDPCTSGEYCDYEGFIYKCTGGTRTDCEDDNPCTADTCDESGDCVNAPLNGPVAACTDSNICTLNDGCVDGVCGYGLGGLLNCDDENPCTTDSCHQTQGCQRVNNTDPCDDGNPCTENDRCGTGTCRAGTAKSCDDANPCTTDACDPEAAEGEECSSTPKTNGTTCSDGDPCTTGDRCVDGACEPTGGQSCDDGNPCTIDGCDVSGCTHDADIGAECQDSNPCTTGDTCNASKVCQAGPTPLTCPEASDPAPAKDLVCRTYWCQTNVGCKWSAKTGPCDDGNPCTLGDYCSNGSCLAGTTANTCNDSNVCTNDSCDPASGCLHANNTAGCSDNDACTTGDICAGGSCTPGAGAPNCDDSNQCTTDTCVPATGCQHAARTGQSCDDGNPCTTGETCSGTTCQGGSGTNCSDSSPCTDDSCNPASGCVHTNDNTNFCSDSSECTSDACVSGACVSTPIVCNDGNPCTIDSCNPLSGCTATNENGISCDDTLYCTVDDTCVTGTCGGPGGYSARDCSVVITEPQCQSSWCNEGTNLCLPNSINEGLSCGNSDNTECTNPDTCGSGVCLPNHASTSTTCGYTGTQGCTNQDYCDGNGNCHDNGFKPYGTGCISDNNSCTSDICGGGASCIHPAVADGTACGSGPTQCSGQDTCSGGSCSLLNHYAEGTACGDPSDTACTNPDTCNGGGSCQSNNEPHGTPCATGKHCDYSGGCTHNN